MKQHNSTIKKKNFGCNRAESEGIREPESKIRNLF